MNKSEMKNLLKAPFADFEVTDLYENCPKCHKPVIIKLAWFERKIQGTERNRWGERYDLGKK